MKQILNSLFHILISLPYNVWLWVFVFSIPLIILRAQPSSHFAWQTGRFLLAILLGYVLINLAFHTNLTLAEKAYHACEQQLTDVSVSSLSRSECSQHQRIADGAGRLFYLILGWVPVLGYIGLCELYWRLHHRAKVKELEDSFKAKRLSTAIIVVSIPMWLLLIAVFIGLLMQSHYNFKAQEYDPLHVLIPAA